MVSSLRKIASLDQLYQGFSKALVLLSIRQGQSQFHFTTLASE
jgi:hypothetical protein